MFSKVLVASAAISLTSAIQLKTHHLAKLLGVNESCGFNIQRATSSRSEFRSKSGGRTLFRDSDFPADESSLFWRNYLYDNEMPQKFLNEVTGWARPQEILDSINNPHWGDQYKGGEGATATPNLWGTKGVLPAGTNQGGLGDCWFLASASSLAEHPERIMNIFTNTEYDSAGIFQVTFYLNGEPVKIEVDDRLPISEGTNEGWTNYGVKTPFNANMSSNGAWW